MTLPLSHCTRCHKKVEAATLLDSDEDVQPDPGDISLCIYCCHIMIYADDMILRDLTEAEIEELKSSGHLRYLEEMQLKLRQAKTDLGAKWN